MLGGNKEILARDTVFGDFDVIDYGDTGQRSPMMDFFLDFWRRNGGADKSVSRADISPAEMKQYLEHIVLLDVGRDRDTWNLNVRLIGSHVSAFYGEITGKDVREMKNSKAVERIYFICGKVLERNEPVMTLTPAFAPDKLYMEALALYMPLFNKDGEINKIMVAVQVSSPG